MLNSLLKIAVTIWALSCSLTTNAQQANTPQQLLHQSGKQFVAAFDRGDAAAIAELWTHDGDYIDETGQRYTGRPAIKQRYTDFFIDNPGVTISIAIDSIRVVNEHTAIEDGRAFLSPMPAGAPAHSRYLAVHVKSDDGRWLISSVRDIRVELPSHHSRLSDLEFLVGHWQAENRGVNVQLECDWFGNKNFLQRTTTVTDNGFPLSSNREIIGWDPQSQHIRSWIFSSDGGSATGLWSAHDEGWIIETSGVLPDSTPTGAVYVLTYVDANAMVWKSILRSRGEEDLPDTRELILKRFSGGK